MGKDWSRIVICVLYLALVVATIVYATLYFVNKNKVENLKSKQRNFQDMNHTVYTPEFNISEAEINKTHSDFEKTLQQMTSEIEEQELYTSTLLTGTIGFGTMTVVAILVYLVIRFGNWDMQEVHQNVQHRVRSSNLYRAIHSRLRRDSTSYDNRIANILRVETYGPAAPESVVHRRPRDNNAAVQESSVDLPGVPSSSRHLEG